MIGGVRSVRYADADEARESRSKNVDVAEEVDEKEAEEPENACDSVT